MTIFSVCVLHRLVLKPGTLGITDQRINRLAIQCHSIKKNTIVSTNLNIIHKLICIPKLTRCMIPNTYLIDMYQNYVTRYAKTHFEYNILKI